VVEVQRKVLQRGLRRCGPEFRLESEMSWLQSRGWRRKSARPEFPSVEYLMNVHITGGMRVADGDVLMGIFDLDDASFEPKVDRLLDDLTAALAAYEGPCGPAIPWASDVLVARA